MGQISRSLRISNLEKLFQSQFPAALDFIFHSKPRTTAFLFRDGGERDVYKIAKMEVKQICAL